MLERLKAYFSDHSNRKYMIRSVVAGLILLTITAVLGWFSNLFSLLFCPDLSWPVPNGFLLLSLSANIVLFAYWLLRNKPLLKIRKYREDEFDGVVWRWKYKIFSIEPVVICENPFCKECGTQLVTDDERKPRGKYLIMYSRLICQKCDRPKLSWWEGYPYELARKYRHQIEQRVHELMEAMLVDMQ